MEEESRKNTDNLKKKYESKILDLSGKSDSNAR